MSSPALSSSALSSPLTAPAALLPSSPVTPIFDEVDRWWRDGGSNRVPGTMLTFAGAAGDRRRPVRVIGARHQLEA